MNQPPALDQNNERTPNRGGPSKQTSPPGERLWAVLAGTSQPRVLVPLRGKWCPLWGPRSSVIGNWSRLEARGRGREERGLATLPPPRDLLLLLLQILVQTPLDAPFDGWLDLPRLHGFRGIYSHIIATIWRLSDEVVYLREAPTRNQYCNHVLLVVRMKGGLVGKRGWGGGVVEVSGRPGWWRLKWGYLGVNGWVVNGLEEDEEKDE